MGSPDFALPTLRELQRRFRVVGVVTQPDRPAGRGKKLTPPPVKTLALELGLPVIQPRRLRELQAMAQLRAWAPDVIVVAAFGQILKPEVLNLPPHGCINVHASLLPRWRGAAPINAAILHGDAETGVTIMQMDEGLDTGPILAQRAMPIGPEDTAGMLFGKLAALGAELLGETLPRWLRGEITPQPQDDALATYAPMLKKEDGRLDFTRPADELARMVRAFHPWPGAWMEAGGRRIRVHAARAAARPETAASLPPGARLAVNGLPAVAAADGLLILERLQPAGKKPMDGRAFLAGYRNWTEQG